MKLKKISLKAKLQSLLNKIEKENDGFVFHASLSPNTDRALIACSSNFQDVVCGVAETMTVNEHFASIMATAFTMYLAETGATEDYIESIKVADGLDDVPEEEMTKERFGQAIDLLFEPEEIVLMDTNIYLNPEHIEYYTKYNMGEYSWCLVYLAEHRHLLTLEHTPKDKMEAAKSFLASVPELFDKI